MTTQEITSTNNLSKNQYTLWQVLGIWLAGGAPMWLLGWVAYPAMSAGLPAVDAGLLRMKLLTVGLIWQFVLAMIILYLGLFFVNALFNTFLGEEFLFRGVLLPKMEGVFGKWDWVANAVIFGFYHLHEPWVILDAIITGLIFTFTGKRFHSNWFPIILHSGQSVFLLFLILGLVLGLA